MWELEMTPKCWAFIPFLCAAALACCGSMHRGAEAQTFKKAAQGNQSKPRVLATHKVAIQVDQNDKAVMDLALNNASNILEYYKLRGERVDIEMVTFGPGLHMLRADTSPVKE